MSVIKMYVDVAAATYEAAQIDIPADGTLYAFNMQILVGDATPVNNESVFAELSFISSPQFASNDSRGSIGQVGVGGYQALAATTVIIDGAWTMAMSGLNIHLNAGERIYLHATPGGSITATVVAYMYIDDGMDQPRAVRRR